MEVRSPIGGWGIGAVGTAIRIPLSLPAAVSMPVRSSRFAGREVELVTALLCARDQIEAELSA